VFITNHVLAGALVGAAWRRRPGVAFAVGFASHVVMDLTPHWGDATLDRDGFYRVARRDGLLGLAVLAALVAAAGPARRAVLAGIAGACLLDADKPCEHLLGVRPFPAWLDRFHAAIQTEAPRFAWTEGAAVVLGAAANAAVFRHRPRTGLR
jgi:hypothetical protein